MLWDKTLETGIESIDAQHRELFRRIDMLSDKSNDKKTVEMLAFLEEYVHVHFRDEEALQARSKYPKAAEHKGYHAAYVDIIRKLKERLQNEGDTLLLKLEVNKQVFGWLRDHILVHDKEFARYYRSLK
ncbi:MAG: hemerythrin family protein [Clostridiales bacterium]|nr:hemerythrin family protein [Clostridiales bacterium]